MAELVSIEDTEVHGPAGRLLGAACKLFAIGAGLVLTGMALMSLASIVGRTFLESPIIGDYELVQSMCAVAVSLSLPYTHWIKGHVIVDFFTLHAPKRLNAVLDCVAHLTLAIMAALVCWRLWVGLWQLKEAMDASMLLSIPTWWTYTPMVASFGLLSIVALYASGTTFRRIVS